MPPAGGGGEVIQATRQTRQPGSSLARALLIACSILLGAAHLVSWAVAVQSHGGLEAYVRGIDFTATLTGARIVASDDRGSLYDHEVQRQAQERVVTPHVQLREDTVLPYIHPPLEAILFAPLLALPYGLLYLLWSVGTLAALGVAIFLLARAAPLAPAHRRLLLVAIVAYSPLYFGLWLGQSTAFILLGLCGAYAALRARREVLAGAALSLVALKPQLLIPIALILLLRQSWRTLAACAAVLAGGGVAAMAVLGWQWPLRYASFLLGMAKWQSDRFETPHTMYSLRGLVANTLGQFLPGATGPVAGALALGLLGFLCWLWRQGAGNDTLWAAATATAVLISPHLYTHDLLILVLPFWLIGGRLLADGATQGQARLLLGGWYLASLAIFLHTDEQIGPTVVLTVLLALSLLGLITWQTLGREPRYRPAAASG